MKKRIAGLALVTVLVIGQAASVLAAGSSTIGGSGSSGSSSSSSSTSANQGTTASGNTTTAANGTQIVNATTNANGEAVVGNTAVGFANATAATAGLPVGTVAQINAINAGASLADNIKDVDLTGYNSLIPTMAIVTKDNATGLVNDAVSVPVTLYVPNLVAGLNNVQILFYNNSTGRWELIAPTSVDPVTKQVNVNIKGSGTLTVVYKN